MQIIFNLSIGIKDFKKEFIDLFLKLLCSFLCCLNCYWLFSTTYKDVINFLKTRKSMQKKYTLISKENAKAKLNKYRTGIVPLAKYVSSFLLQGCYLNHFEQILNGSFIQFYILMVLSSYVGNYVVPVLQIKTTLSVFWRVRGVFGSICVFCVSLCISLKHNILGTLLYSYTSIY